MNTPQNRPSSWLSMLVRSLNLAGMVFLLTVAFAKLYSLAAAHADKIDAYELAHPEVLPGWTLITGGALPIVTGILYLGALALLIWKYRLRG